MCTRISIKTQNKTELDKNGAFLNTVVVGRTMDFAKPTGQDNGSWAFGSKVDGVTVAYEFKGKFKTVQIGLEKFHIMCDGMNKQGLSLESLWLPDTTFNTDELPPKNATSAVFAAQHILGTCKDVGQVIDFFKGKVMHLPAKFLEHMATTHMSFTDLTGRTIVVEFKNVNGVAGTPVVYENPIGVMTNAPSFPWHLDNLRNYVGLGLDTIAEKVILGVKFIKTGFGNNLFGLPADPTPPSRFVRTAIFASKALEHEVPDSPEKAVLLLDKLLGQVNVIAGTSGASKWDGLKEDYDYTQWTVYKDLKNYKLYQRADTDWGIVELPCPVVRGDAKDE